MPLGTEVGPGPDDIVLAPLMERGTVRLCRFRHISMSGLGVGASRASFIAFFAISAISFGPVCYQDSVGLMEFDF